MRVVWILFVLIGLIYAEDESQKHSLKCNMLHIYEDEPDTVETVSEMFTEGLYYGRLRFNSFGFHWNDEVEVRGSKTRENHAVSAFGGSFIFKSGILNGFSFGAGFYTAHATGTLEENQAGLYKAGKGTFSRYDLLKDGEKSLTSFAEAYLSYNTNGTSFFLGRQGFESFLTKTNDTKMIPNTFEGVSVHSTSIPGTLLKMAYFTRQKLRDHSEFHHVLAYGDDPSDPYASYSQNDDSAMHRGLTLSALRDKDIDDKLYIFEAHHYAIDNLTLFANYTAVPKLISSAMLQANYRLEVGDWAVIPALRYMKQFDDGAGAIGGANLKELTDGYVNPESLDASMLAARIDMVQDTLKLRLGYTKVADEGDIVAPWRGFPTAGFTRAMAQYNWNANTTSYMVQLDYEFENMNEFKVISRFALQDFDDNKIGAQADSKVFTVDFFKGLGGDSLYLKSRYAHVSGDKDTVTANGLRKLDPSYDELRLEINYLF